MAVWGWMAENLLEAAGFSVPKANTINALATVISRCQHIRGACRKIALTTPFFGLPFSLMETMRCVVSLGVIFAVIFTVMITVKNA